METRARRCLGTGDSPRKLTEIVSSWNHFTNAELKGNHDDLLRAEVDFPEVSFVFQYISH